MLRTDIDLQIGDWVKDHTGFPFEVTNVSEHGRSIQLDNYDVWFYACFFHKIEKPKFPQIARLKVWLREKLQGGK